MSEYTTTPNLGLYKPDYNGDDELWGLHLNANADVIDMALTGGPFVPLAGTTMLGMLTLFADPVNDLDACTKHYADTKAASGESFLPLGGGTMTGMLTLFADPVGAFDAATKHYVDLLIPAGGGYLPIAGGTVTGPTTINIASTTTMLTFTGQYSTAAIDLRGTNFGRSSTEHTIWLPIAGDIAWSTDGSVQTYYDNIHLGLTTTADIIAQGKMRVGGGTGPVIMNGTGVPTMTMPTGSLYLRDDGTISATVYISHGGGAWYAIGGA